MEETLYSIQWATGSQCSLVKSGEAWVRLQVLKMKSGKTILNLSKFVDELLGHSCQNWDFTVVKTRHDHTSTREVTRVLVAKTVRTCLTELILLSSRYVVWHSLLTCCFTESMPSKIMPRFQTDYENWISFWLIMKKKNWKWKVWWVLRDQCSVREKLMHQNNF